jgi:hypothetical protein
VSARAPVRPRRDPAARAIRAAARCAPLAAVLLLVACDRGPARVHVESVRVAQGALAEPLRAAGVTEAALATAAEEALAKAGFRLAPGGRRAHRARFDVLSARAVPTGVGALRLELGVELELIPVRGPGDPVREAGRVSRVFGTEGAASAWRQAVEGAAARAAQGLSVAFAAEEKPRAALLADLDADDPRARAHAARVLGARRDPAAVSALLERLEDDHPDVVDRAVGALARIGEPRAVGPLIALSRRQDAGTAARLARVIGEIGGAEAEGYLLTVEAGHPDPRVRRAAREALMVRQAHHERISRSEAPDER